MRGICLIGLAFLLVALPLGAQQAQQTKNRQRTHSVSVTGLERQIEQLQAQLNDLKRQVAELQANLRTIQGQTAAKPADGLGNLSSVQIELAGFENECSQIVKEDTVKTGMLLSGGVSGPNPADLAEGTALGAEECSVRLSKIVDHLVEVLKQQP